jgi:hypothetical protein
LNAAADDALEVHVNGSDTIAGWWLRQIINFTTTEDKIDLSF